LGNIKKQLGILDGMRGVAAIMVVYFHLLQAYFPNGAENPLHHAFLAVDFFFMMSGFVIGYAYDNRINYLTVSQFMKIRLTRLHPLVLLGLVFGILGYLFDPFVGKTQSITVTMAILTFLLGFMMLPSSSLPNRSDELFSLNGVSWSLFQEYLVNILYGMMGKRISNKALMILVGISSLGILFVAKKFGSLHFGWGWSHFWIAPIKVVFPFFTGLLLFRMNWIIKIKNAFPILTLLLVIIFVLPNQRMNGLYEAVCVLMIFPLMIAIAAGSNVSKQSEAICKYIGQISYPIYILHYPFVYLYTHWVKLYKPGYTLAAISMISLSVFFLILAILANKYYDEPVRKWLNNRTKGLKHKIQMAFKFA
jgi:peptidoglycan/LPS O-acetylase OafA/YrhL